MIARSSPPARSEVAALLEELRALNVDPPTDAVAALALAEEVERLAAPPDVGRWVGRADLSTLAGFNVLDTLHAAVVQLQLATPAGRGLLRECVEALTARAVTALADDTDPLIDSMRPGWDAAAAIVATAAATGIRSASTAADAINLGEDAATCWRTLPPALASLDRLHQLRHTLLAMAGRSIRDDGPQSWLDRSQAGPIQINHREEIPAA